MFFLILITIIYQGLNSFYKGQTRPPTFTKGFSLSLELQLMEPRHTTIQDHPFITTTFCGPNKSPDVFSFQTSLVRPPGYCDQRPPFGVLSPYFLALNYPVNKTHAGERGLVRMKSMNLWQISCFIYGGDI